MGPTKYREELDFAAAAAELPAFGRQVAAVGCDPSVSSWAAAADDDADDDGTPGRQD